VSTQRRRNVGAAVKGFAAELSRRRRGCHGFVFEIMVWCLKTPASEGFFLGGNNEFFLGVTKIIFPRGPTVVKFHFLPFYETVRKTCFH